jgi:hypothetical protein
MPYVAIGVIDQVRYELAGPRELGTCLDDLTNRLTERH